MRSLSDFAAHLGRAAVVAEIWKADMLEAAAKTIEKEAKRVIGTYDYGWPQLAAATKADRVRQGFTANDPLLRSGDLRSSISHAVNIHAGEAFVGSSSKNAVYHELGTSTIPPRPFLSGAAAHKESEIHEKISKSMHLAIASSLGLAVYRKA